MQVSSKHTQDPGISGFLDSYFSRYSTLLRYAETQFSLIDVCTWRYMHFPKIYVLHAHVTFFSLLLFIFLYYSYLFIIIYFFIFPHYYLILFFLNISRNFQSYEVEEFFLS